MLFVVVAGDIVLLVLTLPYYRKSGFDGNSQLPF